MALPRIHLTGNLTGDPELRFTQGGKPIARLRVASSERKRLDDGSWGDGPTCFLDLTAFDAVAEEAAEKLVKGSRVIVTGRLQQRDWETKDGEKRTSYDVLVEDIGVVLRARRGGPQQRPHVDDPWGQTEARSPQHDDDPPF